MIYTHIRFQCKRNLESSKLHRHKRETLSIHTGIIKKLFNIWVVKGLTIFYVLCLCYIIKLFCSSTFANINTFIIFVKVFPHKTLEVNGYDNEF